MSLLEVVWKNTEIMETAPRYWLATENDKVSVLDHMKIQLIFKK